ncbi:hypothetical protein C2E21_5170 isoform B [Chlorella sorokiniana]|uniref:phytol kinase n=1 Tax=Chlorella sorokiniana TaxID=3076 RepID=A0A2P6TPP5_CHLSO|nr:hypothetical protein C2E21_5170 isoform A [Chlorella sorokiniana]PRW56004.1 hypothetical protein C2E21_5170 isoform B [Chlorella sorokiniana]|eukprot:PRW56003.1 hypothetical protein C2E21_5170 isoform A [Chlorella sorokiniana]
MPSEPDAPNFSGWRVGQLRQYLHERGVSTAGAVERSDLIALAEATATSGAAAAAPPAQPPPATGREQGADQPGQPAESFALNLLESLRREQGEIERSLADPASRAAIDAVAAHQFSGTPLPEGVAQLQLGPGILGFSADGKIATWGGAGGGGAGAPPAAVESGGRSGAAAAAMSSGSSDVPDFSSWRVGDLRQYLHERGVSTAGVVERSKRCAVCGKAAEPGRKLKRCGGCQKVRYCGAECQRRHWAGGHSKECRRLQQEAA